MEYLQFKYTPNEELYKIFHKLLELRDCKIYVSKTLFSEFLQYILTLPMKHYLNINYICTGILTFSKLKQYIQSTK